MKKTLLAIFLCITVAFAFTACGSSDESSENKEEQKQEQTAEEKAESLEKEYKAAVDDYTKKLEDTGKSALDDFNEKAKDYSKDSKKVKELYVEEKNTLKDVLKEGTDKLKDTQKEYEDEDANCEAQEKLLIAAYGKAKKPLKAAAKTAIEKASQAEALDKYKAVIKDYSKKLDDTGKTVLNDFNKKVKDVSKSSKKIKELYAAEKKSLKEVLRKGSNELEKIHKNYKYKDGDKDFKEQEKKLGTAYKSAKKPLKESFKAANDKAVKAEKKAAEKKRKAAEKKKKEAEKKKKEAEKKKKEAEKQKKAQMYNTAKASIGKDIDELIEQIGRPISKEISNSCDETNGKEGYYYWEDFYVLAQSEEQDSPMIIKEVGKR